MDASRGPPSARGAAHLPPEQGSHENSKPLHADFDAAHLLIGGGVAIFHLATSRVVLCWHTRDEYWFLPKGRRDVNEESGAGAEREGFEESGFRNRLLPLPVNHRQPASAGTLIPLQTVPVSTPQPAIRAPSPPDALSKSLCRPMGPAPKSIYAVEPILTQLLPVTRTVQYLLHWYVAETLSLGDEARVDEVVQQAARARGCGKYEVYARPSAWPDSLTLQERVGQDQSSGLAQSPGFQTYPGEEKGESREASTIADAFASSPSKPNSELYQPVHHRNTGVDAEEALYESELVPVEEAVRRLERTGMDRVVRWGWALICQRWAEEESRLKPSTTKI